MRTIADHDIQHDDGHFRILASSYKPANAQFVVHHWVQAANGKFIFTQVNDASVPG